jgi:glycosyltransferase involved in cell wall biosynthesis
VSLRLALATDAPHATSGYSIQCRHILRIWRDLGHEACVIASFGHHGTVGEWDGFRMYPGGLDGFGNDVIGAAVRDFRADVLVTLKDLWVYRPQEWGPGVRWCPLVPVDHDPLPAGIAQILRAAPAYATIAYSEHGRRNLHDAGFAPYYAPHAYDPAVLYPEDRAAARAALGIRDTDFIVGMVAVNRGGIPSRKAWPQNLEGFAIFARQHPGARLFCHTYTGDGGAEGAVNLLALADQLGIGDRIAFIDQEAYKRGLPDNYMRRFYSAIDVLNAVSLGEGFGVPTLEAQACGTPVLVGDWCAQQQLCFAGAAIPPEDALRFYDGQGAYVYVPHPQAIGNALGVVAAEIARDRAGLRQKAIDGARRYEVARVREDWRAVLSHLEDRLRSEVTRGVLRIVHPASVICPASDSWAADVGGGRVA